MVEGEDLAVVGAGIPGGNDTPAVVEEVTNIHDVAAELQGVDSLAKTNLDVLGDLCVKVVNHRPVGAVSLGTSSKLLI